MPSVYSARASEYQRKVLRLLYFKFTFKGVKTEEVTFIRLLFPSLKQEPKSIKTNVFCEFVAIPIDLTGFVNYNNNKKRRECVMI